MAYISGGNELLDPLEILARLGVKTGSKVADLGCGGAGHFIIPAAHLVGSNTVAYAADIMKTVLHAVASKARIEGVNNIRTVWTNLENVGATNIKEKSLDFSLLINVLFQSKNRQKMITEAIRLLKDEGKLLVIDWNKVATTLGPPVENRVDEMEIKKTAQSLNLKLVDEFKAGKYHYGLIFQQ